MVQEVYERTYGLINEFNARAIANGDEATRARIEAAGYRVRVIRSSEGWSVMGTQAARMAGRTVFAWPGPNARYGDHNVAVEFIPSS